MTNRNDFLRLQILSLRIGLELFRQLNPSPNKQKQKDAFMFYIDKFWDNTEDSGES